MDAVEFIAVGRVGPAHGNNGDVFVEPWTDAAELRFAPGSTLRTDPAANGPLTVDAHRFQGDRFIVRFAGFGDRDAVATLRSTVLLIAAHERPPLDDPDEFYDSDLVGLPATTSTGTDLGPVLDVVHLAGATYLLLEVEGVERMVPFVSSIVVLVDIAHGTVVIDPPDGLFDL